MRMSELTLDTKAELGEKLKKVRAEWETLLAQVGEERMDEPNVEGSWSVRDIFAHLTAYERWTAIMVLTDERNEKPTNVELYGRSDVPPEIEIFSEDAYNTWVVEYQHQRPLRDVLAENQRAHQLMLQAIESLSESELKDANRFTWLSDKSLWQVLPNQSFNHYAMHMPAIREWLSKP